jgi:hypothetical protein
LLRWAPTAGFGLLLLALARQAARGVTDPDAPWHILAGRLVVHTGQFAGPDPLSTFTTRPWVMHQWLPEVLLAGADRLGGLPAVAWLAQLGITVVALSLYLLCRRSGGHLAATIAAALAVVAAAGSLSPRPQLVGFVLLAATVGAWLRTAEDLRPRWWLVPLTWLWACSHGTWVMGLLVGSALCLGIVLDRRPGLRHALLLASIPALEVVASLVTPVGPRLWESLATVSAVSPWIEEWRRPSLTDVSTIAVLVLAGVVAAHWILRPRARSWAAGLLFALGLVWALWHQRTVAVGAIMIAPLAAAALSDAIGRGRPPVDRAERLVVAAMASVTLLVSALLAASGPATLAGVPTTFDARLRELPARSVVYNADGLGGWLMWSHPDLRQTFDTRIELYGPDAVRDYLAVMQAQPGWEQRFDRASPAAAVIDAHVPLAHALDRRGWVVVGREQGYVLMEPPAR